jgi:hypothetical protein
MLAAPTATKTTALYLRNILSKYLLFEKAQQETEKLIAEGKIKLDDIEQESQEIIEHRGNYLKKVRNLPVYSTAKT